MSKSCFCINSAGIYYNMYPVFTTNVHQQETQEVLDKGLHPNPTDTLNNNVSTWSQKILLYTV